MSHPLVTPFMVAEEPEAKLVTETVCVSEFQDHICQNIRRVEFGHRRYVITRRGRPVAELVGFGHPRMEAET